MSKFEIPSRFFWMIATGAIFAFGLWAFVTIRNSGAAVNSDRSIIEAPDDVYLPVEFTSANIIGGRLNVTGTASRKSAVNLYHTGPDGVAELLASVSTSDQGRWSSALSLAQLRLDNSAFSIELISNLQDGTSVRSTGTLFVVNGPRADIDEETPSGLAFSNQGNAYGFFVTEPGGPSLVLKSPFGGLPERNGLTLESIEYDNSGGVIFNGTAAAGGLVAVVANETLIGETGIGDDGRWVLISGSTLPVGAYEITLIWRGDESEMQTGFKVPFERLAPDVAFESLNGNERMTGAIFRDDHWQLSRQLYGGGVQNTVVYSPLVLTP